MLLLIDTLQGIQIKRVLAGLVVVVVVDSSSLNRKEKSSKLLLLLLLFVCSSLHPPLTSPSKSLLACNISLSSIVFLRIKLLFVIIVDTLKNEIIANHPLVVNEPRVRFYAGANIIVDNCNVGTFCIMDFNPRNEFDTNSVNNLLDITAIITDSFVSYRQTHLDRELEAAKMSVRVLFNLKYPLSVVNILKEELFGLLLLTEKEISSSNNNNNNNNNKRIETLMTEMKRNLKILESTIETNLSFVRVKYGCDNNNNNPNGVQFDNNNNNNNKNNNNNNNNKKLSDQLNHSFETIKTFASLYNNNNNNSNLTTTAITLDLESKYEFQTYNNLLNIILYTSVMHYLKFWTKIEVYYN